MAQFTIQGVSTSVGQKGKNTWNIATVKYDSKGESKSKQVVSFRNPEVYSIVKDLKEGDVVEVSFTPGDEYYNWSGVKVLGSSSTEKPAAPSGGKVTGSNYETKEERAHRQVLIVKQNALTNAVAACGNAATDDEILSRAQTFADWVLAKPDILSEFHPDDVPF